MNILRLASQAQRSMSKPIWLGPGVLCGFAACRALRISVGPRGVQRISLLARVVWGARQREVTTVRYSSRALCRHTASRRADTATGVTGTEWGSDWRISQSILVGCTGIEYWGGDLPGGYPK